MRERSNGKVANLVQLREMAPDLPFIPVLQGFTLGEYVHGFDQYATACIDLAAEPIVMLGSVCRREATTEIHAIVTTPHARGITQLHASASSPLASASTVTCPPRPIPSPGPSTPAATGVRPRGAPDTANTKNCASRLPYALAWRRRIILPRLAHPHPTGR